MHAACECVCVCIWYMCVFLHVLMCVFGCVCVCTCVCVLICKYNIKTPNQNYIPAIVDISTTSLDNLFRLNSWRNKMYLAEYCVIICVCQANSYSHSELCLFRYALKLFPDITILLYKDNLVVGGSFGNSTQIYIAL